MTQVSKFSKWTPSSTGYKSTGKSYGNSSFWMDDDFLDRDDSIDKVDVLKLAGYKRAISNFVRIVTGKDDIKVLFNSGRQSYTDGKTVVISSKLDESEFDSTVGLALHEGSHIALTDFNTLKKRLYWPTVGSGPGELNYIFEKHQDTITQDEFCNRIKALVNIIEDRRIDRYIYDNAPGYKGYYQSLYDKYFNAKEIDNALLNGTMTEENWDCYEFHICNFANPNRQLNSLKALRRIWNLINLPNISRLKSTDDVFDVAVQVYCLIHDEIGWVGTPTVPTAAQPTAGGEEEGADEQMAEGNGNNDNGEDDNLDAPTGSGQASQKLSKEEAKAEKEKKALDKAIAKQKQFLNGNIKKKQLTNKDADRVDAIAAANMEYAEVGGSVEGHGGKGTTQCIVVRGVNTAVLNSQVVNSHWLDPKYARGYINNWRSNADYVQEGINLGTMLGKRLKTRDEERSLKTTRMETGRIDKRLISELGFGNDRVFSQTIHNTVTPSIVHISIDASGSMCSGSKWSNSVKTAVAIAKAASMVSSLDVVISLRGSYQNSPLMWIVYDSRKDKFNSSIDVFYGIQASGSTPEGLCYQAVMKDIVKAANGKDAYLINLCDGEPAFGYGGYSSSFYYGGDYALKHTAAQVEKMRKEGIKVLGYFIGESSSSSSMESFKKMYGKDSEFIDTNSLTQLSKSLNALFERK